MSELEIFKMLSGNPGSSLAGIAASITMALVGLAVTLPKILNSIRADRLDGNVLVRLQALEEGKAKQDEKIHRHAIRITKLCMLLLKFHGLLVRNNIEIPKDMIDEMVELTREMRDDE